MRIHIDREQMTLLRSLGSEGRLLWQAIESLRTNQSPADSFEVSARSGRREMHVRVGTRGFWLQWEARQDRGETVIDVMLTEN